jgi:manganese transport protein
LHRKTSPIVRRAITLVPAALVIISGVGATQALVFSQVALSFGIPFAVFPLVRFTSNRNYMGAYANSLATKVLGYTLASGLTALNAYLIVLSIAG